MYTITHTTGSTIEFEVTGVRWTIYDAAREGKIVKHMIESFLAAWPSLKSNLAM